MKLIGLAFLLIMMSNCQLHSKSLEQTGNDEATETQSAIDSVALKGTILKNILMLVT